MPFKIGDFVTLIDSCEEGDERSLCYFPFGQITEVHDDGHIRLIALNSRDVDPHIYHHLDVSKFLLDVEEFGDNPAMTAGLVSFDPRLDLVEIFDIETGELYNYHIDYVGDFIHILAEMEPTEHIEKLRRSAKNLRSMKLASKEGVMKHLPLSNNIKGKLMSYVTGFNMGKSNEKTHGLLVAEAATRGKYGLGAGIPSQYSGKVRAEPVGPGAGAAAGRGGLGAIGAGAGHGGGKRKRVTRRQKKQKKTRKQRRSTA